MRYSQIIGCGLLLLIGTLSAPKSALVQTSKQDCDKASNDLRILEKQKEMYEKQRDDAQKRIDADRAKGKPIREEDLGAVRDANDHLKRLEPRIQEAQKKADRCKDLCVKQKGMSWCDNEHACIPTEDWSCNRCGCGVTR